MICTSKIKLQSPYPIQLAWLVSSHGWAELQPWIWDNQNLILSCQEYLNEKIKVFV